MLEVGSQLMLFWGPQVLTGFVWQKIALSTEQNVFEKSICFLQQIPFFPLQKSAYSPCGVGLYLPCCTVEYQQEGRTWFIMGNVVQPESPALVGEWEHEASKLQLPWRTTNAFPNQNFQPKKFSSHFCHHNHFGIIGFTDPQEHYSKLRFPGSHHLTDVLL